MSKLKPDPELIDNENPEWTDEMFESAKSLDDSALPSDFKATVKRGRGRPFSEKPKQQVTVRFSADIIEYFKSGGKGWQTRMERVLEDYVAKKRA